MSEYEGKKYEDLLTEAKERYSYGTTEWKDIRAEGAKNMRYIAGDPWEEKARKAREAAGRVCLTADELGQYVNQTINDFRANKRGIKVSPVGNGANDKTASFRQGKIRDIEYRSNAQQAYTSGGQDAIQRNAGYWRIKAKYVSESKGFDQEPVIEPIVNPDLVTPDPDFVRPDGSDWKWLFFEEARTEKEFNREYPGARFKSFNLDAAKMAPGWVNGTKARIAEYWTKEIARRRKLLLLKPGPKSQMNPDPQPWEVFEDEFQGKVPSDQILKVRKINVMKVCQYITNGLEVLEENEFPGQSIPFVSCYGKILYLDEGGGPKRKILSMISLARDPYMLYCFYLTQMGEMASMIPKVPVMVYKGQLAGLEHDWQKAIHEPMAFLNVNAKTEETGDEILPLPQRLAYDAGQHLQALELCREGARRAIQAAMGMSPLPTQAQRHSEKSGIALKQIESSGQKGTFHFADSYDGAVTRTGAILNEVIPFFFDTARETSIRKPDDSVLMVTINDPKALYSSKLEPHDGNGPTDGHTPIMVDQGDHDVTISVGPAMESERDAASQFADTIVGSKEIMMVAGPEGAKKLLGAAIRLKNVGPIGDEMAEIIDPKEKDGDPKQAAAQAQQQLQQMHQQMQEMGQALQQAFQEKQAKKLELDSKERIAKAEIESKERMAAMDRETKLGVAELGAKVERMQLFLEERARVGIQGHEGEQAAFDRSHEINMAALGHLQSGQQAQQGADHAAEASDMGHQQALEQGQQAAALAPQPEAGA